MTALVITDEEKFEVDLRSAKSFFFTEMYLKGGGEREGEGRDREAVIK